MLGAPELDAGLQVGSHMSNWMLLLKKRQPSPIIWKYSISVRACYVCPGIVCTEYIRDSAQRIF